MAIPLSKELAAMQQWEKWVAMWKPVPRRRHRREPRMLKVKTRVQDALWFLKGKFHLAVAGCKSHGYIMLKKKADPKKYPVQLILRKAFAEDPQFLVKLLGVVYKPYRGCKGLKLMSF